MGKSIRSNQKKALRSQRRAQIVTERVHLTSEGRKEEAMAKCLAAPVIDLPLPTPATQSGNDDVAAPAPRRGRMKNGHKFLLPVPLQVPQQDEQMEGDNEQPSRSTSHKRSRTPAASGRVGKKRAEVGKKRAEVGEYSGGCLQKRVPKFSKSSRKKR